MRHNVRDLSWSRTFLSHAIFEVKEQRTVFSKFIQGGFSWSAIFLYVYTGQITFKALGSQDVTPSEKEAQDDCSQGEIQTPHDSKGPSAVAVEPCSPRSVYRLANKVHLAPL